ncbi:MAG: hypothetical protein U0V74_04855 [Chitinophagales bacterium]
MLRKLYCYLLFLLPLATSAQGFDFNENCRKAYADILALKLTEAQQRLNSEKNNAIAFYLEDYVDFVAMYAIDTKEEYDKRAPNRDIRLEKLRKADKNSPWYLFCQAEVQLHWAAMNLRFGEYVNAVFSIRSAYKLLEDNKSKYPDFKPNDKTFGVVEALLGSIPDKYQWAVNMLGMDGSVNGGLQKLNNLVEYGKKNDYIFKEETAIYYAFLLFHLKSDKEKAWQVLKDNNFMANQDLMSIYSCVHIGVYGSHNDEALKLLEKLNNKELSSFNFLHYLYGLAKLNSLDTNAESSFKKFLAEYKGENHIKSTYQKLGWNALLKNDTIGYLQMMAKADALGSSMVDADKQAQKEAESNKLPNINLLKARLLFDGGYYTRAYYIMRAFKEADFATDEEKTEYFYRLGRVNQQMNKDEDALICYKQTINKGSKLPRYFAANAAYESGVILEGLGQIDKAKEYYRLSMTYENHEYKNGIDQKAKAALNRLR